mmetsp:Transcript_72529/g.137069  ORF Transcript_72529/g.137069 Transcript_72529/m.137069 type:complete len:789 (+) Transcript_72529:164-2530(+)
MGDSTRYDPGPPGGPPVGTQKTASNPIPAPVPSNPISDQKTASNPPARRRDYDMCMVFVNTGEPGAKLNLSDQMRKQQRETVLKNLQNCGLHIFCHYSRDRDEIFCKVGANAQQLRSTAARIKYKLQLKPEYLSAYAEYRDDFPGRLENHYTDRRLVSHLYKTHSHEEFPSEDSIFSTRDKIFLINYIITSKDRDCAGVNVGNLLESGELKAYFPLHEDRTLHELGLLKKDFVMMSPAHADKVREYFGEKITFYFLFMSFYWKCLLIPAALGLVCQLADLATGTPENAFAVPFCIFMSVWTMLLPHFWRRQEAKYAITFGTLDMVPEFEPCRPKFWGENRINPVTAQIEPYYPWRARLAKYIFSGFVLMVTAGLLVALILVYVLTEQMHPEKVLLFNFILALIVEVTNSFLSTVATWLTDNENHRTQSEYEMSWLVKTIAFKFVSSYFVLYYIAFVKVMVPTFFGVKMSCRNDDCFEELQLQLAMFVLVKMTLSNVFEYLLPKLCAFYRGASERKRTLFHNMHSYNKLELADMSQPEIQSKKEPYSSFSDFDEVLVTHGYTTLFAVTSPWVCTASLLWVMLESFMDVKGITEVRRRPLPERVRTNDPWNVAFDIYGVLGVTTNITLLVFTSEQFTDITPTYRLVLWIFLLHAVFLSAWAVKALFPERPRSVELLRMQQANMIHRCLENIKLDAQNTTHQDYGLIRHQAKSERIPILEQDMHDLDAEDDEPHFSVLGGIAALYHGMVESLSMTMCCTLLCAFGFAIGIAAGVILYNMRYGDELPDFVHR